MDDEDMHSTWSTPPYNEDEDDDDNVDAEVDDAELKEKEKEEEEDAMKLTITTKKKKVSGMSSPIGVHDLSPSISSLSRDSISTVYLDDPPSSSFPSSWTRTPIVANFGD